MVLQILLHSLDMSLNVSPFHYRNHAHTFGGGVGGGQLPREPGGIVAFYKPLNKLNDVRRGNNYYLNIVCRQTGTLDTG